MRDAFHGFYRPTDEDYDRLWKDGLVVFDTNALLNLYRLPPIGRDALLRTLEFFQSRIWIPYHVGLEFHRNRFKVVEEQNKLTKDALAQTEQLIGDLKKAVRDLNLDQHGFKFETDEALEKFDPPLAEIAEALKRVQASELNLNAADEVRDRLDVIIGDKIGPCPSTQEQLDELTQGVDERFERKTPPGWKDHATKKSQTFIHDHLVYNNSHGDLILWRQLLAYCKVNNVKAVLFVTNENKEDWWWKEHGETIGPLQELVREIRREAGVDLFWMYKTDQFLKTAKRYTENSVEISDKAVEEITEAVKKTDVEQDYPVADQPIPQWRFHGSSTAPKFRYNLNHLLMTSSEMAQNGVISYLLSTRDAKIVEGEQHFAETKFVNGICAHFWFYANPDIDTKDLLSQLAKIRPHWETHSLLRGFGGNSVAVLVDEQFDEAKLDRFYLAASLQRLGIDEIIVASPKRIMFVLSTF